jgi:hypothetical protein
MTHQYNKLDKILAALFHQIYGLRRTYPSALIYAPEDMGECGESRISDIAQIQKWTYLHSTAHLNQTSSLVVSSLLRCAMIATITDHSYYCFSLIAWGRQMSLTLTQSSGVPLPTALVSFMSAANSVTPQQVYTDGFFALHAPLMAMLARSTLELAAKHSVAATGVYLPPIQGKPAVALRISTAPEDATDAYYQELLGISILALLARTMPIHAFSDCLCNIPSTPGALACGGSDGSPATWFSLAGTPGRSGNATPTSYSYLDALSP